MATATVDRSTLRARRPKLARRNRSSRRPARCSHARRDRRAARRSLVDLLVDGVPAARARTSSPTTHRAFPARAGARAALLGTLWLMVLTAAITVPLGIGAAIYLEEFAPSNRFTRAIETNIANLAGVPSIVYGLLGARRVRPRAADGHGPARRRADAVAARPADRDHRVARSAAGGPDGHPRRRVRARRDAVGGRPRPGPARPRSPA